MKTSETSSLKKVSGRKRGFSLIELLAVIAIMGLLVTSGALGITSYSSQSFTKQAYDLKAVLASAQSLAMAKNTFVWVGFASPTVSGQKSLVVTAYSSRDGLNDSSSANLNLLVKPMVFSNFGLASFNQLLGSQDVLGTNILTESSPSWTLPAQTVGGSSVAVSQAILFSPSGQCFLTSTPVSYIEIGIQPVMGAAANARDIAALRVSGLTSQVELFRN